MSWVQYIIIIIIIIIIIQAHWYSFWLYDLIHYEQT